MSKTVAYKRAQRKTVDKRLDSLTKSEQRASETERGVRREIVNGNK